MDMGDKHSSKAFRDRLRSVQRMGVMAFTAHRRCCLSCSRLSIGRITAGTTITGRMNAPQAIVSTKTSTRTPKPGAGLEVADRRKVPATLGDPLHHPGNHHRQLGELAPAVADADSLHRRHRGHPLAARIEDAAAFPVEVIDDAAERRHERFQRRQCHAAEEPAQPLGGFDLGTFARQGVGEQPRP